MNELALFAGAGGGILGAQLLGWRTVCAVEFNAYAASVLCARQNDGLLPPFPIWDDVRTFDGSPWRGRVDVVSGGFPCQDISAAGKGAGIDGDRSGLWSEFARIIREVRPRYAFIENSPMLTTRGLDRVLSDLAAMGFDARWCVLGADAVGAPHRRDRIWIVGFSNRVDDETDAQRTDTDSLQERKEDAGWTGTGCEMVANPESNGRKQGQPKPMREQRRPDAIECSPQISNSSGERCTETRQHRSEQPAEWFSWCRENSTGGNQWDAEPNVGRVANGVAARVDRLTAIGNGQVPQCAAQAWRLLTA